MPRKHPTRPTCAPVRWLLYCRQSDTDDAGERSLSLESQERTLRDAAEAQGASVVAAVRDADLKGYQDESQRPALAEALRRADAGDYDVLAVWELSRLARKLSLQERVLDRLAAADVRLYSHREPWASATMVRQILGAVAEEQTRAISAHVRRAVRERMRAGKWQGRVPFGYRLVDERLAIDEPAAAIVRRIFAAYRDGQSMAGIARALNADGVPRSPYMAAGSAWDRQNIRIILTSPTYIGTHTVMGTPTPNAHPAIIDVPLFAQVQERNARDTAPGTIRYRRGRLTPVNTFLADGRLRCGCGRRMTIARREMGNRDDRLRCVIGQTVYTGVICTARPRSISLTRAELIVRQRLADDLARVRPWRDLAADLRRSLTASRPDRSIERRRTERERTALVDRQDRLRELYLSGRATLDEYDALLEPIARQLKAFDALLAAAPSVEDDLESLRTTTLLARKHQRLPATGDAAAIVALMEALGAVAHMDPTAPDGIRLEYAGAMADLLDQTRADGDT